MPKVKKKPKPTLADTAIKRGLLTPEYAKRVGGTLEKVGDDAMSGRGETTFRVRSAPVDRLYHGKPQALTREQYDAGTMLQQLYMASGLHQIRAQDMSRPVVDCAPPKRGIELQLTALTRYTGSIAELSPEEFRIVKAVVIDEVDVAVVSGSGLYRGRDNRIEAMTLLRSGLDRVAVFLGIAPKRKITP